MCTVWAALFLFLSLSVSVPLFPTFLLLLVFVVRLLSLSPSLLHFVSQRPFSFSPASFRPSFPILRLCSSLSLSLAFSPSLSPSPPDLSVCLCLTPSASLFSRYLFVFRALSIFLPLLSPSPDFSSPLCPSTILLLSALLRQHLSPRPPLSLSLYLSPARPAPLYISPPPP